MCFVPSECSVGRQQARLQVLGVGRAQVRLQLVSWGLSEGPSASSELMLEAGAVPPESRPDGHTPPSLRLELPG